MKFVNARPFANPEIGARKVDDLAKAIEAARHGRIRIEKN